MTNRSDLTRMIRQASTGQETAQAVAALDDFDRRAAALADQDRETDLGARIAAQRLMPFTAHEHHTAATDWIAEYETPGDYRTAMIAEASVWYRGLPAEVRADSSELAAQADGRARSLASGYGLKMGAARNEFMSVVAYLHGSQAASGLPQIDQITDPNNQPQQTPYPTQVFPTFAPDQDPYNAQVEGFNHDSQVSSQQAPLIQTVMQQDAGGSGYGSGPERPDAHTTSFDTADSYAEVPLGAPGTIPTAPAATDSQGYSSPNPVAGVPQDAGAERRTAAVIAGYSLPDPFGYRWAMQPDVMHPFHERCGSGHWPDEDCSDRSHTASVAVGYLMDIDAARRQAQCEAVGVQEGLRAITSSHSAAELGAAHNRFTSAWGQTDRTDDDSAVLHGFMAVVRPVLSELSCTGCKGGDCGNCADRDCACARHPKGTGSRMGARGLAAGGVTESERESAAHHLPGTDKFPVNGPADVENAKHDIGRTSEPRSKVINYIDQMAKEYHVAPVGGKD
jgi:hypothetical protein